LVQGGNGGTGRRGTKIAGSNLSLPAQIGYGAGQIAGQVFRDVPSLLLLFFMTSVLGINPALAGSAIFLPKLIGGIVFDVSAGLLSDRWQSRFSRRHWLLIGMLAAPVALILLFNVPPGSEGERAAYVVGAFAVYMAAFASFSVPYLAFAGDLKLTPHQRTVLMAWRLAFTAIGVLIAGAVAPGFVQAQGGGEAGYSAMAMLLAAICAVSLLIGWWGAGKAEADVGADVIALEKLTFGVAMTALADRRFLPLAIVNLLQLSGAGMAYAGLMYFMTYNLGLTDALAKVGPVVLLSCVGILAAQPVWVKLSARYGKKRCYIAAALIHALAHLGWAAATWGGLPFLYGFALLLGIGNSGWALLGFSMLADLAGEGKAGLYSAVFIALDKIAFALGGALIIGLILAAFNFDSAAAATGGPQPASALTGILLAFSIMPALCNILAAAIFAQWGKDAA
jgi:GPH family glycoside/pentoside/hexuronide:cation symporter